ncbi:MAG: hypothetical protein ABSC04_01655 [Syntrophobacteraceae bacterium]|jgi:hypothetical protein
MFDPFYLGAQQDMSSGLINIFEGKLADLLAGGFQPQWFFGHLGFQTGRYYSSPCNSLAAESLAANTLYMIPVMVPLPAVLSGIGVKVTTPQAGALGRLGIYGASGYGPRCGTPGGLVVDAGEISLAAAGEVEIAINQLLYPGLYFLAIVGNNSSVQIDFHTPEPSFRNSLFGLCASDAVGAAADQALTASYAYGPLPEYSIPMNHIVSQLEPHIWLRA